MHQCCSLNEYLSRVQKRDAIIRYVLRDLNSKVARALSVFFVRIPGGHIIRDHTKCSRFPCSGYGLTWDQDDQERVNVLIDPYLDR